MTLVQQLLTRKWEFNLSLLQLLFYATERRICHGILRRYPPKPLTPNLLNLGCGPHIFPGWVNADDYALKRRLREPGFRPDWSLDITRTWRCMENYWDGFFTEHVIEHITYSEAIFVFKECLRSLKPGAWIRISVPDLGKYAKQYMGEGSDEQFPRFPHPALAISFLTQMHLHKSVWDADLMVRVLTELGFRDARVTFFGKGADGRLIQDDTDKAHESLYVEAQKP